jgi:hypothetical protein
MQVSGTTQGVQEGVIRIVLLVALLCLLALAFG